MSGKEGADKRRRPRWPWLLALLLVVGGGLTWYFFGRGMSSKRFLQLLRDKNVALGLLENLRTHEADPALVELRKQLPKELFPVRNLAICRLLALRDGIGDLDATHDAINQMLKFEDESLESCWLAAKFITYDGTIDPERVGQAVQFLTHAAEQGPRNLPVRYQLYQITRYTREPELVAAGEKALAEAYAIAPDNIYLQSLWLQLLLDRNDAELGEALQKAREVLEPFQVQLLREKQVDMLALLDQAISQAKQSDSPDLRSTVHFICNSMVYPEAVHPDLRQLDLHELDLVVVDFGEEFYAQAPAVRPSAAAIAAAFSDAPAQQQPPVDDARDVELADMNLDGRIDLVVLSDAEVRIVAQQPDATWRTVASAPVLAGMSGLLLGDMDRDRDMAAAADADASVEKGVRGNPTAREVCHDADLDIVVFGESGIQLLRTLSGEQVANQPADAADQRPLALEIVEQDSSFAFRGVRDVALADIDHDADLDLVVSSRDGVSVWLSLGETMKLKDASRWSLLPTEGEFTDLAIVDWDRDVDIDVVMADAAGQATGVLENLRHGRFRYRPLGDGWPLLSEVDSVAVVESDGNVSWDYLVGGKEGVQLLQTTTAAGKASFLRSRPAGSGKVRGLQPLDFDNDGFIDLVTWTKDGLQFLRGDADGQLSEVGSMTVALSQPRVCRAADVDRDGDLDLAVVLDDGALRLLSNQTPLKNRWLRLRAMGRDDNKGSCNHTGIGATVEVKSGDRYQAQVVTSQATNFGLGQQDASAVRIVWTNGLPQTVIEPPSELSLCELMILKGSCPYVYTWTGERYEFFTDCLWAAPLGLQLSDGVIAPSRAWEYLRIPGERLRENDGHYRIQLTEELWEAGYFDQLELIAVDHPADFEVYSNEKVGPPAIAEPMLHTVRRPRQPLAARDQRGRDIAEKLARADGDFVKAFDKRLWAGLTEEHFLELDLGNLSGADRVTLFLTGWIYPTNTSLNIAFSQAPEVDAPRLPEVWVPDAEGKWQRTIAYMGFPGGKTKTIAVDLSDAFLCDDHRVRIVTTAEIYWDQAFFTVDEAPAEIKRQRLPPQSADLHYRGFSKRLPGLGFGPERYDYDDVGTAPQWPPMRGNFTRYGDVLELLTKADDRMAILAAGDEMTVSFKAPPPPPPGWKRDFLLHCVGWDKDADLNTYHGQSVEPLPFQAMTRYPYAEGETYPDSPAHRDYLRRYQTRRQNPAGFWRVIKDISPE